MKYAIRLTMLAAACSLGLAGADDAQACKFLKKLFHRSSCCQPSCCEAAPSCGCSEVSDCGCGGEVVVSDCGCGGTVTGGEVIIEEPTEVSPADAMPAVPEPPAAEVENDEAAGDAVEDVPGGELENAVEAAPDAAGAASDATGAAADAAGATN